jgi:nitroimidazol reductase NimA-like FMN-containing flavoprotein (pyridoxamine 5'-phosphate oxidase superfamily)
MKKPDAPIEDLSEPACWALLGVARVGRLAVTAVDGIDIFPVNFMVGDGVVYFRSAPGQKLVDVAANPIVAFEVDGVVDRRRWSVVVRGGAHRLSSDSEIEASGVQHLKSYSPANKWNYVRITPSSISGRRFTAR